MDVGECDKFMVSMHYVYGSALLGRLETVVSVLTMYYSL